MPLVQQYTSVARHGHFGEACRKARESQTMVKFEFAKKMGINSSEVDEYEYALRKPSQAYVEDTCIHLQLPLEHIMRLVEKDWPIDPESDQTETRTGL